MLLSYVEYHHFIMMSLMSGEHNTLALSLQDECHWRNFVN
ncbi:ATPase [Escherichia coli]|nr:ATPase [Escherichia coli]